ncbi:MAG: hypothetical protein ACK5W1_14480, partial [Flavobacteriales bacterium]
MDILSPILPRLSYEEVTKFRLSMGDNKRLAKERKLLELLWEDPFRDPYECAGMIYRKKITSLTAYQSLRGRLLQSLVEFVAAQRQQIDHSPESEIFVNLHMAKFLIEKAAPDLAMHFLQKADDLAVKLRHYEFRHLIIRLQMEHAEMLNCDIEALDAAWSLNGRRIAMYRTLVTMTARARKAMEHSRLTGVVADPSAVMAETFDTINLDTEEANDPAYLLAITKAVRNVFIPTKNYKRIDQFASRFYQGIL